MKLGTSYLAMDLGDDFIEELDNWKKKIFGEGLRNSLKRLIKEDLNKQTIKRSASYG